MHRHWHKLILCAIFILGGLTYFIGIDWGLPSRESDRFLFGQRVPWTGQHIMDLAGAWDESAGRGADIAMHPVLGRDKPVGLNETDAQRAEIVRRYRLYSCQPDEMITFRSLSGMKPAHLKLDPKLYQYGGLWIYPVGMLLRTAAMLHLIKLRTDLAFYLDDPQAFARFYLVARMYSAVWGIAGVAVVYLLGKEWTGKRLVGITAAGIFASMPLVIDLAHEAKPHLAGTVLILLTILSAMRFARTGQRQHWIIAGVTAGAAMGMVLTGYVAFIVLAVMALHGPNPSKDRIRILAGSGLIGFTTFAVTNPYLFINALFHRELLHSNVGNYGTFYQPAFSFSGLAMTARCIVQGASIPVTVVGVIAVVSLCMFNERNRPTDCVNHSCTMRGLLILAPVMVELLQVVLLARGKTIEYARFALLIDIALALAAATLIGELNLKINEKRLIAALLVGCTLLYGIRYDINFVLDNRSDSTRRTTAAMLQTINITENQIAVWAEPAPYCLPPVNLFTRRIVLMPIGSAIADIPPGTVAVRPVDHLAEPIIEIKGKEIPQASSPISWANKPFEILRSLPRQVSQPTTRP